MKAMLVGKDDKREKEINTFVGIKVDIIKLFDEAKTDLISIVSEIQPSNIIEKQQEINYYLEFLRQGTMLRDTTENAVSDEVEYESITDDIEIPDNVYPFVKRLKGGWLEGTEIYVPETVVRNLELEEGDLILPTPIPIEPGKYYFKLIQKNPNPIENLSMHTIKYGKIKKKDGFFMVSETIDGPIRIDEVLFEFLIKDDDVLAYKLEDGDIVDIAYYKSNITKTARVIWKHDSNFEEYIPPKPSSYYKDKTETKDTNRPSSLNGKTILIVGCEFKKDEYKKIIEEYSGEVDWIEGTEDAARIEAKVKKADCVLLITTFQSHRSSTLIVDLAKKWNKPFSDVKVTGNKTILDNAFRLLNVS